MNVAMYATCHEDRNRAAGSPVAAVQRTVFAKVSVVDSNPSATHLDPTLVASLPAVAD